jgi:ribosomal protein S27E
MKVTYLEEIEHRTAFSRKMYCPACGSHMYKVIHQLHPEPKVWRIECEGCGHATADYGGKSLAKREWEYGSECNV